METKLMAMILGVSLVLATTVIYTQTAFAIKVNNNGNGVTDGQQAHGLATACSHSTVADNNPNCSQTSPGHGLRVKPVEGW
jgi:hypothetical protein